MQDENKKNEQGQNESAAARRLRLLGEDIAPPAVEEDPEEAKKSPAKRKWENFWYHHKWKVIIVSAFTVILTFCFIQLLTRTVPDGYVAYAGPEYANTLVEEMENAFADLADDRNGDGDNSITVYAMTILTEEQAVEKQKEAEAIGDTYVFNRDFNNKEKQTWSNGVFAGEIGLYLVDPSLYEQMAEAGALHDVSDVLGFEPSAEMAHGEHGILLKKTAFAAYYKEAFGALPEDTVLCVRTVSGMSVFKSPKKEEARNEFYKELLRRAVAFEAPAA